MFDVVIVGSGVAGATFALKMVNHSKVLMIDEKNLEESIPIRTNIFPEHNRPFIPEVDWNNKEIFPTPYIRANYLGDKENGIIDASKFGTSLGNICYTDKFIEYMINQIWANGGEIKFGVKVKTVSKTNTHLELNCNNGEIIKTRLLAIATGSHDFSLQQSLGFEKPDEYQGICVHLHGDENKINDNLKVQYVFHLNPKISTMGPFFINKGIDRLYVGFLGKKKESPAEFNNKLDRILQNYKRIQPFIKNLKKGTDIRIGNISKHPISTFSNDRTIIIGEAAGLVTSFFYEGIICGLASAHLAAETLIPLLKNESIFTKNELHEYDKEINRVLLKNYFRNGNASEYLFYNDHSYTRNLWNLYCKLIKTDLTSQKYIYDAHVLQDLSKHDLEKDKYVGEKLFGKLPALSKITLSPRFLKAMLI